MAAPLRLPVYRALQLVLRHSKNVWRPRVQSVGLSAACKGKHQDRPRWPLKFCDKELRQRLSLIQYHVTQEAGTERPFTGEFTNHKEDGTYACVVCGTVLFSSDKKFDSGSGWPSFSDLLQEESVTLISDFSCGMHRFETRCSQCGAHLGHVFDDGPAPTGRRYCINSAALAFRSRGSGKGTPPGAGDP